MMIRNAATGDVDAIIAIDRIAATEEGRRQQIRGWVDGDCAIVALIDDQVVGYAALDYTFFYQGFISMLIVQENHRRKGVAKALIWHLEETCRTEKLFTSTNESNGPMRELMATVSFEPCGVVHNIDDGDPEIFYFKRL